MDRHGCKGGRSICYSECGASQGWVMSTGIRSLGKAIHRAFAMLIVQATIQLSSWLGLAEGSSWQQIVDEVKVKHPEFLKTAMDVGKAEAEKCVCVCY